MRIPIYIDGAEAGTLSVTREDGGAVFDARLRDVGRVVRLYVYGPDGAAGYLGVPMPEDGGMRLQKRVRGRALADYSETPLYAAEEPMRTSEPAPEAASARRVIWLGGRAYYF